MPVQGRGATHASALYREGGQPMPVPVEGRGATHASACTGTGGNHCQRLYREGGQPIPMPGPSKDESGALPLGCISMPQTKW